MTFCDRSSVSVYCPNSKEANGWLPEEVDTCWRSADFNARHNPSPLGWNPGHCCLANLCHVCERVILHNLE